MFRFARAIGARRYSRPVRVLITGGTDDGRGDRHDDLRRRSRRRAWETLPRARAWLEDVRPAKLLVPAIAIQWLTTLALALTVATTAGSTTRAATSSGTTSAAGCSRTARSRPRSSVTAGRRSSRRSPRFGGPTLVPALPGDRALQRARARAGRAALHVRDRESEIGGQIFGYWAVAALARGAVHRHQVHRPPLPPALHRADAAAGVRAHRDGRLSLDGRRARRRLLRACASSSGPTRVDAIAAGLAAGTAIAIKPSNARLPRRRRPRPSSTAAASSAPLLSSRASRPRSSRSRSGSTAASATSRSSIRDRRGAARGRRAPAARRATTRCTSTSSSTGIS